METASFDNGGNDDVIYLNDDDIFMDGINAYGIFYLKVSSKKFWSKWSRRVFIFTHRGIRFWKQKEEKRKKSKYINFFSNVSISGLENVVENGVNYLTFQIIHYKNRYIQKVYTLKSYNINSFSSFYKMIDSRINNKSFNNYID
jgi:hypothetical protein